MLIEDNRYIITREFGILTVFIFINPYILHTRFVNFLLDD